MSINHLFRLFTIVLTTVTVFSCTTAYKEFNPHEPTGITKQKHPNIVAIVLPEALCSYSYNNGNLKEFYSGKVICENVKIAARRAFQNPRFYNNTNDIRTGEVDAIAILQPHGGRAYSIKRPLPARFITSMDVTWEFRIVGKEGRYRQIVNGDGLESRGITFSGGDPYQISMQQSLDKLSENLYREMVSSFDKAESAAGTSARIKTAIQNFRIGLSTFSEYSAEKSNQWHLYALEERVIFGGSGYGYLLDPASNRHVSVMGEWPITHPSDFSMNINDYKAERWITQWGNRMPVLEVLRPSFYLAEGKVGSSRFNKVYIRELVGSRFDGYPLCELVFEGTNLHSAVLKQRSCDQDYSKKNVYEARTYQYKLSENLEKWLSLRPGMLAREVAEIIGPPRWKIIDSSTHKTILEYGHGRIQFDNEKGLTFWQLGSYKVQVPRGSNIGIWKVSN